MKKLARTAITLLIICGAFAFVKNNGISRVANVFTKDNETILSSDMFSQEGYESSLSSEKSDIAGLTKLDKYNMGLNPEDNSDTDGDGLSDKDEIEKYSSDPLKRSTAGDLYTDAYKVEHNMDVNTFYDYNKSVEFKYNKCPEVGFTASVEDDLWAVCEPWVISNLKGYNILGCYNIYNYEGSVSIDVTKYLTSGVTIKDIVVLKGNWSGENIKKAKTTTNGNIITLKDNIKREDNISLVLATKEKGILASFNAAGDETLSQLSNGADGLVYTWFIWEGLFDAKPTIYYVPSGNEAVDKSNKDALRKMARYYTSRAAIEESDITIVSSSELNAKRKLLASTPWSKKILPSEVSLCPTQYFDLEMITGINATGASEDTFKTLEDTLPFQNFNSTISPGGNCAGIAHLTSYLFNTGSNPSSGSYAGISWDISVDEANATLTNPGLSDYKDRDFRKNHKDSEGLLTVNLSKGEEEFIKMTGAYWAEANDRLNAEEYRCKKTKGQTNYSWKLIEDMMAVLDNNRILDAAFLYADGSGHVINIMSYEISEANPNLVIFRIYDSNYPGNKFSFENTDCHLYVQRVTSTYDNTDSFEYYYKPFTNDDRGYFSSNQDVYEMMVYDENYTFLN